MKALTWIEIVKILKNTELMHDQVARVSTRNPFPIPNRGRRVVLMDFGASWASSASSLSATAI